ncbi:GbsR/MarR family transcriptional regulator, partial [Bacillus amyloliquefaciens]
MEKDPLHVIEQAEDHLIERIAENMHTFGMPATVGRILGIIYMNRKPMT